MAGSNRQLLALAMCNMVAYADAFTLAGRVHPLQTPPNTASAVLAKIASINSASLAGAHDVDSNAARIVLNGGERTTTASADGTFKLLDLANGIYTLEIVRPFAVYSTYRLQVADDAATVLEYKYPGAPKIPASHPIDARPVASPMYFEASPSAMDTVLGLVKSPMVIILVVMGGMMLFMNSMDPEALKEAQAEQQRAMRESGIDPSNPMAMLGSLMGGGGQASGNGGAGQDADGARRRVTAGQE